MKTMKTKKSRKNLLLSRSPSFLIKVRIDTSFDEKKYK